MKLIMKKNKREKGSVVLFVTVTCMFILIMLTVLVMNLSNTKQSQDKQVRQITEQYQVTNQDMEMEYQKKVNNNS